MRIECGCIKTRNGRGASVERMSKIETIFGAGPVNLICPECSMPMRIYLIMPDGPGRDRRTYICDASKHTETIAVKYR
jgi:hypothetical protein